MAIKKKAAKLDSIKIIDFHSSKHTIEKTKSKYLKTYIQ